MIAPLLELAARIEALDTGLAPADRAGLAALAHGRPLVELAAALRSAADPDAIRAAAELLSANESGCPCSGEPVPEPTPRHLDEATEILVRAALAPLRNNALLRTRLGLALPEVRP